MPQEQDFIVVTIEDDDDDDVIIEDSESEAAHNRFSSNGRSTIQQNSQGSGGTQGLAVLEDQTVSQMNRPANLKRNSSNSQQMEFIPLRKKRRPATLMEETMTRTQIPDCEEGGNVINECISDLEHGKSSSSLRAKRQKNHTQTNCVGTSFRSEAPSEAEQPVLREEDALPQIISTFPLQPYLTPGSLLLPGLALMSYIFDDGAETATDVKSSAQSAIAVPTGVLPQGEPSVANNPQMMNYSALLEHKSMSPEISGEEDNSETMNYATLLGNDSGPDTSSSLVSIPSSSEMPGRAETSMETSPVTVNSRALLGNDSSPDTAGSSFSNPPNFDEFELIRITDIMGGEGTSLQITYETVHSRASLGKDSGPEIASTSHSIPPNLDIFGEEGTSLETSYETMSSRALLGNDSGPDTASSSLTILPNFEMPGRAETNMESSPVTVNSRALLGNDSNPDTAGSSFCNPPNFDEFELIRITDIMGGEGTSLQTTYETVHSRASLGKDSGPEIASTSHSIPPNLDIFGDEGTSLETSYETMSSRALLGNDSGPDTASSSLTIPPNFEMPGRAETNMETSPVTVNSRALLGNDSSPDTAGSSFSNPPNFDEFELIRITDIMGGEGTSLQITYETVHSRASLGKDSGPEIASTSHSIPPNLDIFGEEGTSLETSYETMSSRALLGNDSGPDTASSSLTIPPNFEMPGRAETNMESSPVTVNSRALLGNDSNPDTAGSSFCNPPNFDEFELIRITDIMGGEGTSLQTTYETVHSRASLGKDSGPEIASTSHSIPPNLDIFGEEGTSLETSYETMSSRALLGNDSGPDTASSSLTIPPNFEMPGRAETNMETSPVTVNSRALLGNDSSPDTAGSSFSNPPNFDEFELIRITDIMGGEGTSLQITYETVHSRASLGKDSGPEIASTSHSIPPNLDIFGEEGTSLETSYETMSSRALLGNDSGPDTASSSLTIPPNFEMPGRAETNMESSPVTVNSRALLGNDSNPDTAGSSFCNPPNFDEFELIRITDIMGGEGTSLQTTYETVHSRASLGKDSGPEIASTSHSIPPNLDIFGEEGTSLETSYETMSSRALLGNDSGPDTASSSLTIPPNFEMPGRAETNMETSPVTVNSRALLGNDSSPDTAGSSFSNPPNFDEFELIRITDIMGGEGTSLQITYETVHSRASLGKDSGPEIASTSHSIPPNLDIFGEEGTSLETSYETMSSRALLGNDSGPDTASSSLTIPPNFEMPGRAETNMESSPVTVNSRALLGNDSNPDTAGSSFCNPPNFDEFELIRITDVMGGEGTSLQTTYETVHSRASLGKDSGPEIASTSHSILPNLEEEISLETSYETMSSRALLGNDSGPDTAFSPLPIPSKFDIFGEEGTSWETSYETLSSRALFGNDSGPGIASPPLSFPPNFEMLGGEGTSLETSYDATSFRALLGNDSGPDSASSSLFISPTFKMLDKEESSLEKSPEGISYPLLLEIDCGQDPSSSSLCILPSSVNEDIPGKKSTKRSAEQTLSCVVPLSPKFPKTEVHASKEELLSPEESGMPKEKNLPEESKDSPQNSGNSLSPDCRNLVSIHTSNSRNSSQPVPGTSSSAPVGNISPAKSSHQEVNKTQIQKKSEGKKSSNTVGATVYTAAPVPSAPRQGFSKDPSSWSVDEVIQFTKHAHPQISASVAELFRQHQIDGEALLLLNSDMMMNYMGLKLGPALKLCHYIEKLKEGKYDFKNVCIDLD